MPPRRYRLEKRQAAVADTQRKILQATMDLHNRNGILATSFEDIAREADVAVATVYRHFPTLERLVEGCGALTLRTIQPPSPDHAARLFEGVATLAGRLERLVGEFCSFYERSRQTWPSVLRDAHRLPQLQQFIANHVSVVETYVRAALAPSNPDARTVAVIVALLEFPTWQSLIDRGVAAENVPDVLTEILRCWSAKAARGNSNEK